jgi:diguanylate cyclase (GGDEF)-like protein
MNAVYLSISQEHLDSLERLSALVDTPICGVNREGRIVFSNQNFRTWHGLPNHDPLNSWFSIVHPDDLATAVKQLDSVFRSGASAHFECTWVAPTDLRSKIFDLQIINSKGIALVVAKAKETKRASAIETHRTRGRDELTGLPNHAVFQDRLVSKLTLRDYVANPIAVVFVDIPQFDRINFNFGSSVGDKLLVAIAVALESSMRNSKMLARLPGCRFALIFEAEQTRQWSSALIAQIQSCFEHAFVIDGNRLRANANIGLAITSKFINSASALLRSAEHAVLEARSQGSSGYSVFNDALSTSMETRDLLAKAVVRATDRGEIELYYQPIWSLRDRRIVGAEALARWNHPSLGLIHATEFIELAEENGTMLELGEWILSNACRQAKAWADQLSHEFRLAVNVSPNQISLPGFVDVVRNGLDESGLLASNLELDLKPAAIRQNLSQSTINFEALRSLGVSLALDDFGSNGSYLSDLIDFEPDRVKLNPSLVSALGSNSRLGLLVEGMIQTCLTLNIATTAKGIEKPEQTEILFASGCGEGQGYLLAAPVSAQRFSEVINLQTATIA